MVNRSVRTRKGLTRGDAERIEREFFRDRSGATARVLIKAADVLDLSTIAAADVVQQEAITLFDAFGPNALSAGSSPLESFKKALDICACLTTLAAVRRPSLRWLADALAEGLLAVKERTRGFDEPLLRAAPRTARQPRESYLPVATKTLAGEACHLMIEWGIKDAAKKVAKVIGDNDFLKRRSNGKSVVPRTILNWRSRYREGNLRRLIWHFVEATDLFHAGRRSEAEKAILSTLQDHLVDIHRTYERRCSR
jgi:hypothetical protein